MNKYKHASIELEKLWVVTTISNPERYKSRYDLYKRFKTAMDVAKVNLFTVELAFGNRPFEVTEELNPNHLQLRTGEEIWHKENTLNLAISRLPSDWKYVAWIDADIEFCRQDWPEEIVAQLQHFDVIQLFQHAVDLGPTGEVLKVNNGFVYSWSNKLEIKNTYSLWHPGFAWACTKTAFNNLGGLIDFAILGAGDRHMAMALIGKVQQTTDKRLSAGYKEQLDTWEKRATTHIRQNIGYMEGTIYHHFHGSKRKRFYSDRWKILLSHNFDPEFDLKKDWQGLWILSDVGLRLRNDIRNYFRARDEDSTEL
jgi:hypothetical protein